LEDIQKAEQNQADCERRIKELSDVLERSYTDLKDSLNSMVIGKVSQHFSVSVAMTSEGGKAYNLHAFNLYCTKFKSIPSELTA
jgi:hypothetical protein